MTINERLFLLLENKELKASDLASYLNISKGVVSNWKKRGTPPPSEYIENICSFLDVSIEFFITGNTNDTYELSNDNFITNEEKEILTLYNSLDEKSKTIIKGKLYEYEKDNNLKK